MYRFKDGNTLANIGNSILAHYNVEPFHQTYGPLDEVLEKNKDKKVVLFLFDAFGKEIIEKYKNDIPFIYSHRYKTISSVFPPTTVAATTSLLSGLYPTENGHLGWYSYLNKILATTFSSTIVGSEEKLNPPLTEILKYKTITQLINEKADKEIATQIMSFTLESSTMENLIKSVEENLSEHQFIYAYLTDPDHTMHEYGTTNNLVKDKVIDIDSRLKQFVETHKDVLAISLADHGMVDTTNFVLPKDLSSLCENKIFSIEGRAATFFVPKENHEQFLIKARQYFSKDFEIYTKEEVNALEIFGPIENKHPLYDKLLGDFLVVATGHITLDFEREEPFALVANHAGGREEESLLYLCIYND